MKEVTKKIDELVSFLQSKIDSTDVLNKQLSLKKNELNILEEKAVAKLKNVSAMERVYKKYEDFDAEVKKFNNEKADHSEACKLIDAKKAMLAKKEKELDKLIKEQNDRKEVLNKQGMALKEQEANFNKKKDDLKAMISGQAIKDILK